MAIDDAEVRNRITRMGQQVDDRLQNLRVGSGELNGPDLTARRSELEERATAERQLREIEVRQRQADAAVKLWTTVYDPRREEDAARRTAETAAAQAPAPAAQAAPAPTATAPAPQVVQPQVAAAQAPAAPVAAPAPAKAEMPMPKVVTIRGGGAGPLTAQILVPYVGEVAAEVGTRLPGGRRVTRITSSAVIISDPDLGTIPLGFGDSVALSPPSAVPAAGATGPRAQAVGGMSFPGMAPISVPPMAPITPVPLPLTPIPQMPQAPAAR